MESERLRDSVELAQPYAHAQTLLPAIDRLLERGRLALASVEGLAVAAGPGSFTGLRIGIAAMEGLAFALERPIVGVSTLDALAFGYRQRGLPVAAFIDARRGEVFAGFYRSDAEARWHCELGPVCEAPRAFLRRLGSGPLLIAGSAVPVYRELIRETLGAAAELGEGPLHLAQEIALLGDRALQEGRSAPLGGIQAIYLRPSDAERASSAKSEAPAPTPSRQA